MIKRDMKLLVIGVCCGVSVGICCGATVMGLLLWRHTPWINVELTPATPPTAPAPMPLIAENPPGKPHEFLLDGYCPVTLVEESRWQGGDTKYRHDRGKLSLLFAGEAQRQKFLANPARYLPVCEGNDVVLMRDKFMSVRGKRGHGLVHNNEIYLFASENSLQRFAANPTHYAPNPPIATEDAMANAQK